MTPAITTTELLGMLTMRDTGRDDPRGRLLEAPDQGQPADRVFGGLQLAQAVVAAATGVAEGLRPLSLSADFLAGVPVTGTNTWLVEALGTTTSTASRRASLLGDDGSTCFTATVRLGGVRDDLPSYSTLRPRPVAPPETLPTLSERFADDDRIPTWWSMRRPLDIRHVETPAYVEPVEPRQTELSVWWRPDGHLPDDAVTSAAVIAYASDMSVIEPVFRQMGSARHRGPSRILTMTHSLVLHATPPLGWMQMDCRVPTLAHGRAHGFAEIHTEEGEHVATVGQLALVKLG